MNEKQKGWLVRVPRHARAKSISNIYHVMLRGINRQKIFEDNEDRYYFMDSVRRCKEISGFRLHAFCLMTNHVHLLIEPAEEPLDMVFKRIGSRYAGWFNRKYQRVGHLFQDRFRSENVETDRYFMTVLRYILQNPMKAGMESRPGTYRWSSFLAYQNGGSSAVTDTQFAEDLFGGKDALIAFVQQANEDDVMDDDKDAVWRIREDEAKEIMQRITGCSSAPEFQKLDGGAKIIGIQEMYMEKMAMRQIARLTGVSRSTVQKYIGMLAPQELAERKAIVFREEDPAGFWPEEIW